MNPNFTLLSEYQGLRKDIIRKCNICGDIRTVKARSLIERDSNGNFRDCPICKAKQRGKSLRKTHEQFVSELNNINTNIEVLSHYESNDKKVKCKCLIDGFEWDTKPHVLLQGHGCPECSHRQQNWYNKDRFNDVMKTKYPTITVLNEFQKTNTKMRFKCNVCNYEWSTEANALLNNNNYCGCPKCSGYSKVSEQDIIDRLFEINPRVEYVGGYTKMSEKATFRCAICGNEWDATPANVLSGRGCPKCNLSHGALKIAEILDSMKINYETEYRFDDCRYERPLPFDFFIATKNIAIEYDGEQHFHPVKFGNNTKRGTPQERFQMVQLRDKIKTDYCENNGITLIRIPYTDFNNIEEIINKHIS